MTKEREALRLALSTLNEVRSETFRLLRNGQKLYAEKKVWDTIFAIKEALAQPKTVNQFHPDYANEAINEMTLTIQKQAQRIEELEAQVAQSAVTETHKHEPFGYFKPAPFGWTDCAETDEGAIALYEKPQPKETEHDPVAWAETAMRLADDLSIESLWLGSHERTDKYENAGRASWQTVEIRKKREDVRERLRQHVYTTPPQRTLVGLTPEEVKDIQTNMVYRNQAFRKVIEAIEAKLKEKNT